MKRIKRKKEKVEREEEGEKKEMAKSADSNHESSGLKSILVQEGRSGGTTPWNRRESTLRTFPSFLSLKVSHSLRKKEEKTRVRRRKRGRNSGVNYVVYTSSTQTRNEGKLHY